MSRPVTSASDRPKMVFHFPVAFRPNYISGSVVRPKAMVRAFQTLGYDVHLIWGTAAERKIAMQRLEDRIAAGERFEFVYSESVNSPTLLTERHHLPTYPLLEPLFFRRMRKRGIPIGLFYRDIYWRFPFYDEQVPWVKAIVARLFFHFDLWLYRQYLNVFFLPSLEMCPLINVPDLTKIAVPLPPGFPGDLAVDSTPRDDSPLSLIYVGGVLPPIYDLSPLFKAVAGRRVRLTVVCRAKEWQEVQSGYEPMLGPNVEVLHVSGSDLEKIYRRCDVAMLVMNPDPYRDIMMPLKLFEAVGYGLPIVAMNGLVASRCIRENQLGWVVNSPEELSDCLERLSTNPDLITSMKQELLRQRSAHTWEARARTAAEFLTAQRSK
jgi:glycosyltransferase involved in cell wall biosynthesis